MSELERRPQPLEGPDGPRPALGSVFDGPAPASLVTVSHGLHAQALPVGGMTVGQVRTRLRDLLDIDPESQAVLDGQDVDDSTVIRDARLLLFVRRAGDKGVAA